MQRPNEEVGSFAIGLEGILCTIEERDYGGFPVEERDAKLTHQFMRGLPDEKVRTLLAPCDTLIDDTEDETSMNQTTEQENPEAEKAIRANN